MTTILKERRDFITPLRFGAKGDAEIFGNNTCTQGSAVVTNAVDSPFKPSHVGKAVFVQGGLLNGSPLITTVLSYQSATQITLAANITATTGVKRLLVGSDDTAAISAALDYARARAKAVILDGAFISGPQKLKSYTGLLGVSRASSQLILKPGSATVDKFLLGNDAVTDHDISIESLILTGLRAFQTSGAGAVLTDINVISHTGSSADTSEIEVFNLYKDLRIREANRAAIKYSGRGESRFIDLLLTLSTYGLDLNSGANLISGVSANAYGAGFYLGSDTKGCRFVGSRGYQTGYAIQSGQSGPGESACWFLNGASNNQFVDCEGSESWASVWMLLNAARNMFSGCRASDAGCLFTAHGLGASNAGEIRAGWRINASSQNNWSASRVGVGSHGNTSYATHAFYAEGACNDNIGRMSVDTNASGWATAKIGRTHTGERNSLVIDDEPLDINDDSHIDNQRFLSGDLF